MGGGTQQGLVWQRSAPRSNPFPLYIQLLTEKVPLLYNFYQKMVTLSHRPSL